jgi:hypothetical protein
MKITGMDRSVHFQKLVLSREDQSIVSYHTVLFNKRSYDSFVMFMLSRACRILSGNSQPALLVRFTSRIPSVGVTREDEELKAFAARFMATVFNRDFSVFNDKENLPLAMANFYRSSWNDSCLKKYKSKS